MPADRVYLDNAATSFPKPKAVHEAMLHYATSIGASPGRGAYAESREGARLLNACRALVCELIGADAPERVVFTLNATDALNLAIKGVIGGARAKRPGRKAHVVTTAMDHNSVLRPLNALADAGEIEWTCVEPDARGTGLVDPQAIRSAIQPNTALVAVVHASNVSGSVQPIAEIGAICARAGVPLLVDAAQSVGHLPVDVRTMGIDLLAFPGHKGMLGPLGTGGLWMSERMPALMTTLREGGTGSKSESDRQPMDLPDRFEPGSHNTVGLVGLGEGVLWLLDRGIDAIHAHERTLMEVFLSGLPGIDCGYRLLGPPGLDDRCGVFSLVHERLSPDVVADRLELGFGVLARAGLHCAPRAHQAFGTAETGGSVRLSIGPMTTEADVLTACRGLREIAVDALTGSN